MKEAERRTPDGPITRLFGSTPLPVTIVGLGGEGVLRTYGRTGEARDVISEALLQGITYFDSAHVYADSEIYYGSVWEHAPETRSSIFQASKSASRSRTGAEKDLEGTLQRMKTSYLDLWQIHDVRTMDDLRAIEGPGGALEAFIEAREDGRVHFIGVTGHHDPDILTTAVREWPVDAVMMPVNVAEGVLGGFLTTTLPLARERGIAVIGMKVLGAGHYLQVRRGLSAEILIRYALSYDITVAIVGCSNPQEVRILAECGRRHEPHSREERTAAEGLIGSHARSLAYYRGDR